MELRSLVEKLGGAHDPLDGLKASCCNDAIPFECRGDSLKALRDVVLHQEALLDDNVKNKRHHMAAIIPALSGIGKTSTLMHLESFLDLPGNNPNGCHRDVCYVTYNSQWPLEFHKSAPISVMSRFAVRLLHTQFVRSGLGFSKFLMQYVKGREIILDDVLTLIVERERNLLDSTGSKGKKITIVLAVDEAQLEKELSSLVSSLMAVIEQNSFPDCRFALVFVGLLASVISTAFEGSSIKISHCGLQPFSHGAALRVAHATLVQTELRRQSQQMPHPPLGHTGPAIAEASLQHSSTGEPAEAAAYLPFSVLAQPTVMPRQYLVPSKELNSAYARDIFENGSIPGKLADYLCDVPVTCKLTLGDYKNELPKVLAFVVAAFENDPGATRLWIDLGWAFVKPDKTLAIPFAAAVIFLKQFNVHQTNPSAKDLILYAQSLFNCLGGFKLDMPDHESLELVGAYYHAVRYSAFSLQLGDMPTMPISTFLKGAMLSPDLDSILVPLSCPLTVRNCQEVFSKVTPDGVREFAINLNDGRAFQTNTGVCVMKCATGQEAIDVIVVFKKARARADDEDTFELVLFDQRKLEFAGGLTWKTYERGLEYCTKLMQQLKETGLVSSEARFVYGVVDPVKCISPQLEGMIKKSHDLLFAIGRNESKKYHTLIAEHPLLSPVVCLNSTIATLNQLKLCLPDCWTKKQARGMAVCQKLSQTGTIRNWTELAAAACLEGEQEPPQVPEEDFTSRDLIVFEQWASEDQVVCNCFFYYWVLHMYLIAERSLYKHPCFPASIQSSVGKYSPISFSEGSQPAC